MAFQVDERIETSCVWVANLSLSSLYLKKDASYPWLILLPRKENYSEIYQLNPTDRQLLIEEIAFISSIMTNYFKPDKLNVGALGNLVAQLHIHLVARFKTDKAWPHSIWQANLTTEGYSPELLNQHIFALRKLIAMSL
ncbi:MAG: HIT family protein [Tatlockia sp.]|nr:HIT family protein [Tatlockia sp.]